MQNSTNEDGLLQVLPDSELEQMLEDAYDVPPPPDSLLQRIDAEVEQEWGVAPGVSPRNASNRAWRVRASRLLKVWPIAACLALALLGFVFSQQSAHAFGWKKMIDALGRASVVEVAEADGTIRWMCVERGIVGRRSRDGCRLLDFTKGVAIEREAGQEQAIRRPLKGAHETDARISRQQAVVVAFLLDNVSLNGEALQQAEFQVEPPNPTSQSTVLRVSLESEVDSARVRFVLDSDSHLPQSFEVAKADSQVHRASITYPTIDVAERLQVEFPSDMPVVDVAVTAGALATNSNSSVNTPPSIPRPSPDESPDKAPVVGAASLGWKPVEARSFPPSERFARVDGILTGLWDENDVQPAELASEEELLRRIYIDLAGRTPSVSEVRAYLSDDSVDRYPRLVDRLLNSRDHATHLATVWRGYLIPEGIDLSRFGGVESFEEWIGDQFIKQTPYDEIVRRLLLAEGRLTKSGPLLFYAAVKLDPDQLATRSARVFLGMRLDCAQCHDDHFEPWLQEDFWSYAAFFARISRPQGELNNVSTVMRVRDIERGEVTMPETETVVLPRYLDGSALNEDDETVARRRQLAEWLTADANPYFARATVNRVWGQLLGKGIVDPVDGFGIQHEPVSQELLDELAGQFVASEYSLRDLFRTIVLSRAYRLSSGAATADPRRQELFAQMNVKLLTAEQMYDCITVASMLQSAESDTGFNLDRIGNSNRELFLQQFRSPAGRPTEYQAGIPQALTLMNGGLINNATGLASSGLLKTLEVPLITNRDRIEILYMATLSRRATPSEQELLGEYIPDDVSGPELYEALADVLWALLNSAEFTMNH